MRKLNRTLLAPTAALAAAAALAACGGSSTSASSASTAGTSQQRDVVALTQFAGCMRARGLPVPDPNSQGQITGAAALQQQYQNTPQGQAAWNACRSYLQAGVAQLNAAQTQQYRHAQLLFARCMRAHGIQVADPDANGDLHILSQDVNKASPQFQRAASACAYLRQSARQLALGG
jgi:hypothetical protein